MGRVFNQPTDRFRLEQPDVEEHDVSMDAEAEAPAGFDRSRLRRAGALAAALALSVAWLASAWEAVSFAPAALAGAILRATPGDLATFFIESIGHLARPLLIVGVLMVAVGISRPIMTTARLPRSGLPG